MSTVYCVYILCVLCVLWCIPATSEGTYYTTGQGGYDRRERAREYIHGQQSFIQTFSEIDNFG